MRESQEELGAEVVHQHRHIRAIVQGVESTHGGLRQEAFDQLRQYLAAHEAAEQHFLHGPAEGQFEENRGIVQTRLQEEDAIAETMRRLEQTETDSVEFMALYKELAKQLSGHMRAEEHQEMIAVARALSPEQLRAAMDGLDRVPKMAETGIGASSYDDWLERARDSFAGLPRTGV